MIELVCLLADVQQTAQGSLAFLACGAANETCLLLNTIASFASLGMGVPPQLCQCTQQQQGHDTIAPKFLHA